MTKDVEVRHCRALVAVHDCGGVGAAARALGVSQSTVSETLLSLERLLEAPVTLRRAGREAMLTSVAKDLLPHARAVISASEAALAVNVGRGRTAIRLGTVESISSFLLPGPLGEFRMLRPQVEVRITIGLCEDLKKRVSRSELDVALTIEGCDPDGDDPFWPTRIVLVAAPDHPLANGIATRQDLNKQTFLLADSEGAFNDLIGSWVGNTGRLLKLESAGSIDGVKSGVVKSAAIGVLPDYAAAQEIADGSLVELRTADLLPPVSVRLTVLGTPAPSLNALIAKIRDDLALSARKPNSIE